MSNAPHLGQTIIGATPGIGSGGSGIYTPSNVSAKIFGLWFAGINTGVNTIKIYLTRSAVDYTLCMLPVVGGNAIRHTGGANHYDCTQNFIAMIPGLPIDETGCPYILVENGSSLNGITDTGSINGFYVGVEF